MPIKGLTDRGVAFPQIGNIRKGAKKEPNKPGADLPYFRLDFDEREVNAIKKFNTLYPDGKPTAITIVLPFDQIDRVWNPWREAYSAGALLHRCDGEYIDYAINPQTGEIVIRNGLDYQNQRVKCDLQNDPDRRKRCKPTGRLSVIIPELERLAYLVVHTTSIHDIANISDQLAAIREMNGGHIAGIPLILRRRPIEISTPSGENGKRARRVKYLISIEADPEWVSRKIAAMKLAALPAPAPQLKSAVPGPEWTEIEGADDDEDDEVINGEPQLPDDQVAYDAHVGSQDAPIVFEPTPEKIVEAPVSHPANSHPPKLAVLKTPNFPKLVKAVNAKTGHYKTPDHMREAAIGKLNYAEITDKNLKAVTDALIQYGLEQDALKNAPQ